MTVAVEPKEFNERQSSLSEIAEPASVVEHRAQARPSTPAWLEKAINEDHELFALNQACASAGYALSIGRVGAGQENGAKNPVSPAFFLAANPSIKKSGNPKEMPLSAVFHDARGLADAINHICIQLPRSERSAVKAPATKQSGVIAPYPGAPVELSLRDALNLARASAAESRAKSGPRQTAATQPETFDTTAIKGRPYVETLEKACEMMGYELIIREVAKPENARGAPRSFGIAAEAKPGGVANGRPPEQSAAFTDEKGLRAAVMGVKASLTQALSEMSEEQEKRKAKLAARAREAAERRAVTQALPKLAPAVGRASPLPSVSASGKSARLRF